MAVQPRGLQTKLYSATLYQQCSVYTNNFPACERVVRQCQIALQLKRFLFNGNGHHSQCCVAFKVAFDQARRELCISVD